MRKNLVWAILFSPLFLFAQEKGVTFVHGLTWQQILEKAKLENKYVFVDCYATWCGPCKMMDQDVYPNDTIGKFMNGKFISMKIQMDTTQADARDVKELYQTGYDLRLQYSVHAYPSFLFFAPNGSIVYKSSGARFGKDFLDVLNNALNSDQENYASSVKKYQNGNLGYSEMPGLADASKKLGLDSLGNRIAEDFILHYLDELSQGELWTVEHVRFLMSYAKTIHADDKIFQLFFEGRKKIDAAMAEINYSGRLINYVVYKDKVKPLIDNALENKIEPQWKSLGKMIREKYAEEYVENNVLKARVEYYKSAQQWHSYAKYFVILNEKTGIDTIHSGDMVAWKLDNSAYEVFKYSNSKRDLKKALSWIDRALSLDTMPDADDIDTKANILYKLGKKDEAIVLETRSVSLRPNSKEIQENYGKMKSGRPTWTE